MSIRSPRLVTPLRVLLPFLTALSLAGCRLGRYTLEEPIGNTVLQVKSGDRWHFVLDESPDTFWTAEASDELVSLTVKHRRTERKADVEIRVHRGLTENVDVYLSCFRRGEDKPVRQVTVALWRKVEDDAPWK